MRHISFVLFYSELVKGTLVTLLNDVTPTVSWIFVSNAMSISLTVLTKWILEEF
jgi:hypothetical protein